MLGVVLQAQGDWRGKSLVWRGRNWKEENVWAMKKNPRIRKACSSTLTIWLWPISTTSALPPLSAMSSIIQKPAESGSYFWCAGSARYLHKLGTQQLVFLGDIFDAFHHGLDSTMDHPWSGEFTGALQWDRPSSCHREIDKATIFKIFSKGFWHALYFQAGDPQSHHLAARRLPRLPFVLKHLWGIALFCRSRLLPRLVEFHKLFKVLAKLESASASMVPSAYL